jgi:hypothetical protein
MLNISLFHQCSSQMRHVSVEMESSVFTTNTSGQRRIHSRHQQQLSINVWAGLLVTVW